AHRIGGAPDRDGAASALRRGAGHRCGGGIVRWRGRIPGAPLRLAQSARRAARRRSRQADAGRRLSRARIHRPRRLRARVAGIGARSRHRDRRIALSRPHRPFRGAAEPVVEGDHAGADPVRAVGARRGVLRLALVPTSVRLDRRGIDGDQRRRLHRALEPAGARRLSGEERKMTATNAVSRRWQWLAIALVIGWLLWLLRPVLTPFVIAAMLAYLGDPLADRLERLRCNRTLATSIVFFVIVLVLAGALVLLIPLVQRQVVHLVSALPGYGAWIQNTTLPWLQQHLNLSPSTFNVESIVANIKAHAGTVGNVVAVALGYLTRSSFTVIGWATSLVLVPVVTFYLLRDW